MWGNMRDLNIKVFDEQPNILSSSKIWKIDNMSYKQFLCSLNITAVSMTIHWKCYLSMNMNSIPNAHLHLHLTASASRFTFFYHTRMQIIRQNWNKDNCHHPCMLVQRAADACSELQNLIDQPPVTSVWVEWTHILRHFIKNTSR